MALPQTLVPHRYHNPLSRFLVCLFLGVAWVVSPAAAAEVSALETAVRNHVTYLASPQLKGRKPGTAGSQLARQYIQARFKEAGLVPWAEAAGYELDFGQGINVVGVLPGADPALAAEFVLVSAHYDHVGVRDGEIHHGAADNASGVAALLEILSHLSQPEHRPRRPVLFAAFDAEEQFMLGSFAFSLRPDVERARLAGVVNLDLLGRDFLDVVESTLFVAGTEGYPALRQAVQDAGTDAGIQLVTFGSDLVGPRSDHIAFEDRGVPTLFFTSGIYGDYHKPTDTVEKLNIGDVAAATRIARTAVERLASQPAEARDPADRWELDELRSLAGVFQTINANPEKAGIAKGDLEPFRTLERTAARYRDQGGYDLIRRRNMILQVAPSLASRLGGFTSDPLLSRFFQYFYLTYPSEIRGAFRALVADIVRYRPSVFRTMPDFSYGIQRIDPSTLVVESDDAGVATLRGDVLGITLDASIRPSLFTLRGPQLGFQMKVYTLDLRGSPDDLFDVALLMLRDAPKTSGAATDILQVMSRLSGREISGTYAELLDARLQRGGYASETEWLIAALHSENFALANDAGDILARTPTPAVRAAIAELVQNRAAHPSTRLAAMQAAVAIGDRAALAAVCAILDDESPNRSESVLPPLAMGPDTSVIYQIAMLPASNSWGQPVAIGQRAWTALREATKLSLPRDKAAWEKWLATAPATGRLIDQAPYFAPVTDEELAMYAEGGRSRTPETLTALDETALKKSRVPISGARAPPVGSGSA